MNIKAVPAESADLASPLKPCLPHGPAESLYWGQLYGSSYGLALAAAARRHAGPLLLVTEDTLAAQRLEYELRFYIGDDPALPVLSFPDWETLRIPEQTDH